MFLGDLLRQAKAQTCAFPDRLGGKKRLHNSFLQLRRHASSAIDDGNDYTVTSRHDLEAHPLFFLLFMDGVKGVLQQIDDHLRDLHFSA